MRFPSLIADHSTRDNDLGGRFIFRRSALFVSGRFWVHPQDDQWPSGNQGRAGLCSCESLGIEAF
jgi:hypothetical protein